MKNYFKAILVLIISLSLVGCGGSGKSTADIEKKLTDAGYRVSVNKDESVVTVTKDRDTIQTYPKDEYMVYLHVPSSAEESEDFLAGTIYGKSDKDIKDEAVKAAEKMLEEFDLTIEEFYDFTIDLDKNNPNGLDTNE